MEGAFNLSLLVLLSTMEIVFKDVAACASHKDMCCAFSKAPKEIKDKLDPKTFWKTFPCPPPFVPIEKILSSWNWTKCLGNVETLMFIAEKCNFDIPVSFQSVDMVRSGNDNQCRASCRMVTSIVCVLVLTGTLIVIVCIIYRKRKKRTKGSPSHETALNLHGNSRFYSGNQANGSCFEQYQLHVFPSKYDVQQNGGLNSTNHMALSSFNPMRLTNQYTPEELLHLHGHRTDMHLPVSNSSHNYQTLSEELTPSPVSTCSQGCDYNSESPDVFDDPYDSDIVHYDVCSRRQNPNCDVIKGYVYDVSPYFNAREYCNSLKIPNSQKSRDNMNSRKLSPQKTKAFPGRRRLSSSCSTSTDMTNLSDESERLSTGTPRRGIRGVPQSFTFS